MIYLNKDIKKSKKKLEELYAKINRLEEQLDFEKVDLSKIKKEINDLTNEFDYYNENIYAKQIFDYFSKKKPKLIRIKTNEILDWNMAFKENFDDISKIEKYSLIGLIENGGKYKIK